MSKVHLLNRDPLTNMPSNMSKSRSQVTGLLSLVLVLIGFGLTGSVPIPAVPPGCHSLCMELGGVYLECIDECPTLKRCKEAVAITDPHEVYMGDGPVQKPQLCERHCWPANMYTERRCMLDCPLTWCRKYGKVSSSPTSTTTTSAASTMMTPTKPKPTSASSATTISPKLGSATPQRTSGHNVEPIGDQPVNHSTIWIVLGSLAISITVIISAIGIGCCCYRKAWRPTQKEQGDVEEKRPMDPSTGPVSPTSDDNKVTILRSPRMGQ